MNRTRACALGAFAVASLLCVSASGQGMLVPKDRTLPPLAIKSQQVEIAIANQVATTTVKQVFMNTTNRQLEASYVFPMPAESTIRDFAMMVNGKRVSGELVEAAKARQIYTRIVAQARDPGLLEHLGDNLFRVNIFPVPAKGTQTVELSYSEVVRGNGGVYRYTYPMKTGSKASRVQDYFSVGLKLSSKVPIKSVYSPTHQIGVTRKGDHEATVGLEISKAVLDTDFSLYWTVSRKAFGLNAVPYRAAAGEDGYLMLLISPKSAVNADEVIAKDVQFVFDTSGSMGGKKIAQAKKALKYCVENLNGKDRFNIIAFSTDVNAFKEALVAASKANKEAAREYVNKLDAQGGTNIHDALSKAMETAREEKERPQVIVFLTDGRPTIGKTGQEEIVSVVAGAGGPPSGPEAKRVKDAKGAIRVFTFGVGNDVNTHLLDKVAGASGGTPEYVRTGEDIEVKVSDFFAKASHPVMTNLALAFGGGAKVSDLLPQSLPDLYFGQQIVAFGRYSGSGDISVTLKGTVSTGKSEKHTYEVSLPKQTTENDFIEPLWAHRKVGYLLDQIRLNGESKELKDEVIRLSKKYKIQTPYTSYLVLEEQHRRQYLGKELASADGRGGGRRPRRSVTGSRIPPATPAPGPAGTPSPAAEPADKPATTVTLPAEASAPDASARRAERGDEYSNADQAKLRTLLDEGRRQARHGAAGHDPAKPGDGKNATDGGLRYAWKLDDLRAKSGEAAVNLAKDIAEKKKAEQVGRKRYSRVGLGREVAGRTFYHLNGFWVDEKFSPTARLTFVKWGSEAYFAIVSTHEDLKAVFALGTRLILVTAEGKALVVSESEGAEKLSDEQVTELFTKAVAPTTQPEEEGN